VRRGDYKRLAAAVALVGMVVNTAALFEIVERRGPAHILGVVMIALGFVALLTFDFLDSKDAKQKRNG
jgi:hypothetical protein